MLDIEVLPYTYDFDKQKPTITVPRRESLYVAVLLGLPASTATY